MKAPFVRSIRLDGFLSFAPGSPTIELQPLNVLIGPNGSGKSNFLEAFSLLKVVGGGDQFQEALRRGGGASEWIWKGAKRSTVEVDLHGENGRRYQYEVAWAPRSSGSAQAIFLDERFEELRTSKGKRTTYFRTDGQTLTLAGKVSGSKADEYATQQANRQVFREDASILSQHKGPFTPDNHQLANQLSSIVDFREWTFGRTAAPRNAQQTNAPTDGLSADGSNLAMMLQELAHLGRLETLNNWLRKFLPRAGRLTTRISGGSIMAYLHEEIGEPIPTTRLSDGTLRFIALLVLLLSEPAPPLVCIEEPELGLHPDALSLVAELLVEASERTQIVVTTHSDALVSALTGHVESVLVCEYLAGTQLRRLKAKELTHWLDNYRLGDLWRMGELGGNP